ncbi:MAG TPA: helix-turn-helix domain-containing protein [Nocardioidaceae bacterium]|nr:helix-turn-helix domain-containing protein [Nocardioidaceae bacterium]
MASQETSDPRSRLRADARRNYDRLVVAARETFQARGGDATLEQVAKAAGVGIGTLYRHFPSRLALVEAVYLEDVEALEAAATESTSLPPWEALSGWLEGFVEYAMVKHALFAELAEAYGKDSTFVSHCRELISRASALVLSRAQEAGVARDDIEPPDMLRLVHGVALTPNPDPDQVKRMLRVVIDGLRADP